MLSGFVDELDGDTARRMTAAVASSSSATATAVVASTPSPSTPFMFEFDEGFWYAETTTPPAGETSWLPLRPYLHYIPFSSDFGPLNLARVHTFLYFMDELRNMRPKHGKAVFYHSPDEADRTNAFFLIAAHRVLQMAMSPEEAFEPLGRSGLKFLMYRDAGGWPSLFNLHIVDVLRGLRKAHQLKWYDVDKFDVRDYEYFEQVDHGDWNWIVPGKFLAFAGPQSSDFTFSGLAPEYYVPHFKRMGVTTVVRLNNKLYDSKVFTDAGIAHREMYFPDGHNPPDAILYEFLHLARHTPGAIAIHCKAGLGRTGTLIAAYLMRYHHFTAPEAIGYCRVCRPGMVVGPQQTYLGQLEATFKGLQPPSPLISPSASPPGANASAPAPAQPRKAKDGHTALETPAAEP